MLISVSLTQARCQMTDFITKLMSRST